MRRERRAVNLFSTGLFACGIYAILGYLKHYPSANWPSMLTISLLVVLLDAFPVRLPGGMMWSGGFLGFIYVLFAFGFGPTVILLAFSTLVSACRVYGRHIYRYDWFGILTNIGKYFISMLLTALVKYMLRDANMVIQVGSCLLGFELADLLLVYALRLAKGIVVDWRTFFSTVQFIPLAISTVILSRLLHIRNFHAFLLEVLYSGFLYLVFLIVSFRYEKSQQMRQESERKYRVIAENTSDLLLVLSREGVVQFASPSAVRAIGTKSASIHGRALANHVHPDDIPTLTSCMTALEQMRAGQVFELRLATEDSYRHYEIQATPVFVGKHNTYSHLVLIARDVAERMQTFELLKRSEKLAMAGQLAAGIAHEIRNPLTTLKGFLQLVEDRFASTPDYYSIMWQELSRIEDIVSEFLILAKPEAARFVEQNVAQLLADVITLLQGQALLQNVHISLTVPSNTLPVRCEPTQMKQVFINLMRNAFEAMPNGGTVVIGVSMLDERHIEVTVQDDGCGMSDELVSRLGEPFYTTKDKGTGLGFMVSSKIVEDHDGTMRVDSRENVGTIVHVVLPVQPQRAVLV